MSGHIAIRKIAVSGFNQHIACGAHKNGAKRMIAKGLGATGNVKAQAQEFFVIERLHGAGFTAQIAVPNFSTIALKMRSGLNGVVQKRMPVASKSALPIAALIGLYGLSLIDLAPKGPMESQVSANRTSVRGTSPNCGRW